jgi:hypothetical protein
MKKYLPRKDGNGYQIMVELPLHGTIIAFLEKNGYKVKLVTDVNGSPTYGVSKHGISVLLTVAKLEYGATFGFLIVFARITLFGRKGKQDLCWEVAELINRETETTMSSDFSKLANGFLGTRSHL